MSSQNNYTQVSRTSRRNRGKNVKTVVDGQRGIPHVKRYSRKEIEDMTHPVPYSLFLALVSPHLSYSCGMTYFDETNGCMPPLGMIQQSHPFEETFKTIKNPYTKERKTLPVDVPYKTLNLRMAMFYAKYCQTGSSFFNENLVWFDYCAPSTVAREQQRKPAGDHLTPLVRSFYDDPRNAKLLLDRNALEHQYLESIKPSYVHATVDE